MSTEPNVAATGPSVDAASREQTMFPARVPQHLLSLVTTAQAMKPTDGLDVLEGKVRELKNVLTDLNTNKARSMNTEVGDAGGLTKEEVDRTGERRAEEQMPQQERAAYDGWRDGSLELPAVSSWTELKTTEQALRKAAKEFPAGPGDLSTLYKTSDLKLPQLAAWLADSSLSTTEARAALKAIGRVRRMRMRVAKEQSPTGGTRALGVKPGEKHMKGQQKEVRVLRGVLKSTRVMKKDVQSRVQKVIAALKEVENETQGKLHALGTGERHRRHGGKGGRGKRDVVARCGGGIVPPGGAEEQMVVAELGESAVRPTAKEESREEDEMES